MEFLKESAKSRKGDFDLWLLIYFTKIYSYLSEMQNWISEVVSTDICQDHLQKQILCSKIWFMFELLFYNWIEVKMSL